MFDDDFDPRFDDDPNDDFYYTGGDVEEEDDDPFDFEGERIANEFEGQEDEPEPDPVSDAEWLENALGKMSCCGAVRRPGRDDEDPCYNCGAI